jgi:hypothetical protein
MKGRSPIEVIDDQTYEKMKGRSSIEVIDDRTGEKNEGTLANRGNRRLNL